MTGQHEPDPNNRFETWADGMTPAGQEPPAGGSSQASAPDPPAWSPASETASEASGWEPPSWTPPSSAQESPPVPGGQGFPTYPYSAPPTPYANPQQDEAFTAFQGYQASTSYPQQSVEPYQAPHHYGHNPYRAPASKAPFAVPSLVLGIVSVFCGGVTGPIGLGLGIAALKQIESDPRLAGRGLAIAGIATSAFGTLIVLMAILGMIAG